MKISVIEKLNKEFSQRGSIQFTIGPENLPMAVIRDRDSEVYVSLFGAQVLSYRPRDQAPVLWLSDHAIYDRKRPIRGGIPICWPWFGKAAGMEHLPGHGFARHTMWSVEHASTTSAGSRIQFGIKDNEETRKTWPFRFKLRATVELDSRLRVGLSSYNLNRSPLKIAEAFHSYFYVSDVDNIHISGLNDCSFYDMADGGRKKSQSVPITIQSETDRIYIDTDSECVIVDAGLNREIRVAKTGSRSTVIWNLWSYKSHKINDFEIDSYRSMICLETANARDNAVTIAPGDERRIELAIAAATMPE